MKKYLRGWLLVLGTVGCASIIVTIKNNAFPLWGVILLFIVGGLGGFPLFVWAMALWKERVDVIATQIRRDRGSSGDGGGGGCGGGGGGGGGGGCGGGGDGG